ncbi:DgyrCDS14981 [Dimorphilus gyrociliatus]|uniref:DgyrCDS14981 n=1 Tax=Dimorphilus gyrociliatus TaxID=2664684 RepID=A0A7I8WFS9_9ANNE|nr:DgyrCDS14981 [Dimorphilus gyrociliatus]
MEECYSYLWIESGCFTEEFRPTELEESMTISQFSIYAKDVFKLSMKKHQINSNTKNYRLICYKNLYDRTNIAFNRKVTYSGKLDSPLLDPIHIVDGLYHNDISLGSCSILTMFNSTKPKLSIELSEYHEEIKIVLWPTNEEINQTFIVYISEPNNLCSNNVELEMNSTAKVFCSNLKENGSEIIIEVKFNDNLHLCEVEIFSVNLAFKKPVLSKLAKKNLYNLTNGLISNYVLFHLGIDYWLAINLLAYFKVFGLDVKPSLTFLNSFKNFYIELTNENPALAYDVINYQFCGRKNNSLLTTDEYYTILCSKGGVEGQFVVFRSNRSNYASITFKEIEIFGYFLRFPYQQIRISS